MTSFVNYTVSAPVYTVLAPPNPSPTNTTSPRPSPSGAAVAVTGDVSQSGAISSQFGSKMSELWPIDKLRKRLAALNNAATPGASGIPLGPTVLLLRGAMHPPQLGHIAAIEQAKVALEAHGLSVLGTWLVPTSDCVSVSTIGESSLRVHLARLIAAQRQDIECSTWLAKQRPLPSLNDTVRALQNTLHDAFPELRGMLNVFVISDAQNFSDACNSVRAVDRQGVILVPRHGENHLPALGEGFCLYASAVPPPVGQYRSALVRMALQTGDKDSVRCMLPPNLARFIMEPSAEEKSEFGRELADLWPPSARAELLRCSMEKETMQSKPAREKLRVWMLSQPSMTSIQQVLRTFDADADDALSSEEILQAAREAGINDADSPMLLRSLGFRLGGTVKIPVLADRIEENPQALQDVAMTAGGVPVEISQVSSAPPAKLQDLIQQIRQVHAEIKGQLIKLLAVDGDGSGMDSRQDRALQAMAPAPWHGLFQIVDEWGSTALLLASGIGMDRVAHRLLSMYGPTAEERAAYANKQNEMGWTPLLRAAQNGHYVICDLLLNAHADANLATRGTCLTPLMLASSYGHARTVGLLLDSESKRPSVARADPLRTSVDGRTALDFVRGRLKARGCLATDYKDGGDRALDIYDVRRPQIATETEPFSDIERALIELTDESENDHLGELQRDLLLLNERVGLSKPSDLSKKLGSSPGRYAPLFRSTLSQHP